MSTFAIFNNIKRIIRTSRLDTEGATNIFGNIKLDLSKAPLPFGDHILRITNVFGNIKVHVPETFGVDIDAITIFSGVSVENLVDGEEENPGSSWTSDGFERAPIRVQLRVQNIFGSVEVVRLPAVPPSSEPTSHFSHEPTTRQLDTHEPSPNYEGETHKLR